MYGKWSRAALITLLAVAGVGGCGAQDDELDTQAAPLALEVEPDCTSVRVNAELTWPPNHKFRLITVHGDEELRITIDSVTQDELVEERRDDGRGAPDARWVDDRLDAVYLRAERLGGGDGRMYRIHFTATREDDDKECTGTVRVGVPHDQGKGSRAVDSGGSYDSFAR